MSTTTTPALWDEIQTKKPWLALSPAQKIWCLAFLTNGHDPISATELAYHCSSPKNAKCLSYEVRHHKHVTAFLELFEILTSGGPSLAEQIAGTLETIRECPPYAQARARRLLAQLTGCVKSDEAEDGEPAEVSAQSFPIGSIIIQDGRQYRVKAEEIS